MRCAAFVRYNGADGMGHVSWAFDIDATDTDCGAVEDSQGLPSTDPAEMGFWTAVSTTPVAVMAQNTPAYDAYRYVDLDTVDVALAQSTVAWVAQQPYSVVGRNCMDDVYDVLRAYGVPNLPPPVLHWFPDNWFAAFEGVLTPMTTPWRPVPVAAAAQIVAAPAAAVARVTTAVAAPKMPRWRTAGTPEWHDLQAQMAEQSGYPGIRVRAERYRKRP